MEPDAPDRTRGSRGALANRSTNDARRSVGDRNQAHRRRDLLDYVRDQHQWTSSRCPLRRGRPGQTRVPVRRSRSRTGGLLRRDGAGDASNGPPGHRAGAEVAARAPPARSALPGRRLTTGDEPAPPRGRPAPRTAHRRLRGRLLLALVPRARHTAEDPPGVVAPKALGKRATRPGRGRRAHRSGLVRRPRLGARRPRGSRSQDRRPRAPTRAERRSVSQPRDHPLAASRNRSSSERTSGPHGWYTISVTPWAA